MFETHEFRAGSATAALVAVLFVVAAPAAALNITVSGALGDLDGDDDGGVGEAAVLGTAVACWEDRITTNRDFTLDVAPQTFTGGTLGQGAVQNSDGDDIPIDGRIRIDDRASTNWWVDPTPLDSLEFDPDPDSQWHFINGPGRDLLRTVVHEIGHALGWICGPDTCGFPNPRYDAMMVPDSDNFVANTNCASSGVFPFFPRASEPPLDGCVFLVNNVGPNPLDVSLRGDGLGGSGSSVVNELSHPGVGADLMLGLARAGDRALPSLDNVNMFAHAYGDTVNLPPTVDAGEDIVAECSETGGSTLSLDATGSTDPENDPLTFAWVCLGVALSDPSSPTPEGFFPLDESVDCRVDASDVSACPPGAAGLNVTVVDTTDPVITCPPTDLTLECSAAGGNPATDPEIAGFLAAASATDICDADPVVSDDAPAFFPNGETTLVTFTATDQSFNADSCSRSVTIEDTTAPVVTDPLEVSPSVLWPVNHKLVPIDVNVVTFEDTCDPDPAIFCSVESNEPPDDLGDGTTAFDIVFNGEPIFTQGTGPILIDSAGGAGTFDLELRAERSGLGDARIYTIECFAVDGDGNQSLSSVAAVEVPHSRR